MSDDYELIYSSDGSGKNLVKEKKKEYQKIEPQATTLKLRIEKKGRAGKSVTVIYELPNNPPYFNALLKELKSFCGCGGSLKKDHIEIQGLQMDKIRTLLQKKGFQVKGS